MTFSDKNCTRVLAVLAVLLTITKPGCRYISSTVNAPFVLRIQQAQGLQAQSIYEYLRSRLWGVPIIEHQKLKYPSIQVIALLRTTKPYKMASTANQPSRLTVWLYRSLALGSTAAVASHTIPLMQQSSLTNSIQLVRSEEAFLSRSGIRRITVAAGQGETKRKTLLENGAMSALSEVASRGDTELTDAALGAAAVLMRDEPMCVLREAGLRKALLSDCREGCQAVWKVLEVDNTSLDERTRFLESFESVG